MKGAGLLVVNEIKEKRLGHLVMNMERWAAPNVLITNETPERLAAHFGPYFDKVLVDAPCSGEGMFRKDTAARLDWSIKMIEGCAERQVGILKVAAQLVRPGGTLLYSTCTFNPEENEEVILKFLGEFPMFQVSQLHQYPGFVEGQPGWVSSFKDDEGRVKSLAGAVRLFPHRLPGEGHFICSLIRSTDGNIGRMNASHGRERESHLQDMNAEQVTSWKEFSHQALRENWETNRFQTRNERLYLTSNDMPGLGSLRVTSPGIWLGTFKINRFEPAHPLALFLDSSRVTNGINLEPGAPQLQAYLRGESFQNPGDPGWCLVSVDGFGLGWGKRVQGMVKNHYPRGWIRY
jgi:NOL1/NOP2/fmu family ribosome biogenesis protein